jgi:ABC-2 type transport system ATP-binding protein
MIEVKDLTKKYSDEITALNNITFGISEGEICGYIGVNGAGKSTTVKILTGALNFDTGEVRVCGLKMPEDGIEIKRIIGYVPESANIFNSLKVKEYFEFIGDVHNLSAEILNKRIDYFSGLFDFSQYLKESIGILSKGNRQKVLITSALLHNPKVIFLDEPLNGLDANSIIIFQDVMSKLADNGRTVFYCSHLLDLIEKISTKIIIIEKGIIKLNKTSDELKNSEDYTSLENLFRGMYSENTVRKFSYAEAFS